MVKVCYNYSESVSSIFLRISGQMTGSSSSIMGICLGSYFLFVFPECNEEEEAEAEAEAVVEDELEGELEKLSRFSPLTKEMKELPMRSVVDMINWVPSTTKFFAFFRVSPIARKAFLTSVLLFPEFDNLNSLCTSSKSTSFSSLKKSSTKCK